MSNFDTLSKRRIELNEQIKELNGQLRDVKKDLGELDHEIIMYMNEQGQDLARANGYTFSVKKQELYTPTDWALFGEFCEENKLSHLYQKRVTQKAVEEAVALYGDNLPVEIFQKVSLNARKTS